MQLTTRYYYKSPNGRTYEVTKPRRCPNFPNTFYNATRVNDNEKVYFHVNDLVQREEQSNQSLKGD